MYSSWRQVEVNVLKLRSMYSSWGKLVIKLSKFQISTENMWNRLNPFYSRWNYNSSVVSHSSIDNNNHSHQLGGYIHCQWIYKRSRLSVVVSTVSDIFSHWILPGSCQRIYRCFIYSVIFSTNHWILLNITIFIAYVIKINKKWSLLY